jgi:hypothetical protein
MAKVTLPAGPTNLHKNMASGMSLPAAVAKATSKGSSGKSETPKR